MIRFSVVWRFAFVGPPHNSLREAAAARARLSNAICRTYQDRFAAMASIPRIVALEGAAVRDLTKDEAETLSRLMEVN